MQFQTGYKEGEHTNLELIVSLRSTFCMNAYGVGICSLLVCESLLDKGEMLDGWWSMLCLYLNRAANQNLGTQISKSIICEGKNTFGKINGKGMRIPMHLDRQGLIRDKEMACKLEIVSREFD